MSINWDEPIEVKYSGVWSDAKIEYMGQQLVLLSSRGIEYACEKDSSLIWVRNKPQEKWRPFREDELDLLLGRVLRDKSNHDDKMLIIRIFGSVAKTSIERWFKGDKLFEFFDLRQPDGQWGPCGVKL